MKGLWAPPDTRDAVIDFVNKWSEKTELPAKRFIRWLDIGAGKFYDWRLRYGKANEHNGKIPRDFWLEEWEKQAIIDFHALFPDDGYRRLTFMMLDADIVAVSPASVWRVLHNAGLLKRWNTKKSKKGTGFVQPTAPHEHWHIDVSYLNICGTFYYLFSIIDGYSRYLVEWEIAETMTETQIEIVLQRAKERFPDARPRIISDNGPQFIAGDFKEFIKLSGLTHVRTSPYYPQSNGKKERWYKTLKSESIRQRTPLSLDDAKMIVAEFIEYYNTVRLHSAIGYVTPQAMLEGRAQQIWDARDAKLEAAREARKQKRQASRENMAQAG